MSEDKSKKTIHEILKNAFDEIESEHGVIVNEVEFEYVILVDGSVHMLSSKVKSKSYG